jgi:hypothetical protein
VDGAASVTAVNAVVNDQVADAGADPAPFLATTYQLYVVPPLKAGDGV